MAATDFKDLQGLAAGDGCPAEDIDQWSRRVRAQNVLFCGRFGREHFPEREALRGLLMWAHENHSEAYALEMVNFRPLEPAHVPILA